MKTFKYYLRICAISLAVVLLIIGLTGCKKKSEEKNEEVAVERVGFSKEVKQVLEKKIVLIKQLAEDVQIIKAVKESNGKNQKLTHSEILSLDDKWRKTKGMDNFIKSFITNECAQYLIDFQEDPDVT